MGKSIKNPRGIFGFLYVTAYSQCFFVTQKHAHKSLDFNFQILKKILFFVNRAAAAASYYSHTNNLSHHMSRYPQVGKLLLTLTKYSI